MKKILILILTICSLASFGQILQDPNTTPSTARTNEAISGAYPTTGTDAYSISPLGSFSYTYLTGKAVSITIPDTDTNTGPATLNFDGLGVKDIKKWSSGSLVDVAAGELIGTIRLRYDGTQFVMEGGTGSGGGWGTSTDPSGTLTTPWTINGGATNEPVTIGDTNPVGAVNINSNGSIYINETDGSNTHTIDMDNGHINIQFDGTGPTTDRHLYLNGTGAQLTAKTSGSGSELNITPSGVSLEIGGGDFGTTGEALMSNGSGGVVWGDPGSGTVDTGTAGQIAVYSGTTTVDGTTTGTGVVTALGVNVGSSGSIVVNGGALGTPSSGTATNLTGLPISTGVSGLGTGVSTWLATPSWTNFSSAITGTAPFWNTGGATTFTSANTVTGSSSNTFKMEFPSLGITTTVGAGIHLKNPTAAALSNQQYSPSLTFEGNGWGTTGSASQPQQWIMDVVPSQGSTTAGGTFRLRSSLNGGALTNVLTMGASTSNGASIALSGTQIATGSNTDALQIRCAVGNVTAGISFLPYSGSGYAITSGSVAYSYIYSTSGWTANQSGTGSYTHFNATPTFNLTGSGAVSVYGFDYNPTLTSMSNVANHFALRATSGKFLLNATTITASTEADIRGLGTTSSTTALRIADSGNTQTLKLTDDGGLTLSGNIVGRAVLVGGTVTVNTSSIQSADEIFLTNRITGGTAGLLSVGTVTDGTSFVINSASGTDTSTISWMIIKH